MTQIAPAPLDNSDFVPADGPDNFYDQPRANWLGLLVLIPLIYGVFSLGAWSQNHAPQPPPTGPYATNSAPPTAKLLVHVAGAVRHPGVYQLPFDARVN